MQFLAHRGCWTNLNDKNTLPALHLALTQQFGIETDLRDYGKSVVISHDPPTSPVLELNLLLDLYRNTRSNIPLALNIKADGIGKLLHALLIKYEVANYFCFDMSIPETINYRRLGIRYFIRESEHEQATPLYQESRGVWMDQFEVDWIQPKHIRQHVNSGKQVAIVSPELHNRDPINFWSLLKENEIHLIANIMLCTDLPEKASSFFHPNPSRPKVTC
jgi:hypothetical protein